MRYTVKYYYRKYAHWIPRVFILFTVLILVLTLTPDDTFSKEKLKKLDKLFHVLFFGTWTFLFWLSLNISKPDEWPSLIKVFIVATLFGLSIEILQYILPFDRGVEVMDIAANTVGITIVLAVVYAYTRVLASESD